MEMLLKTGIVKDINNKKTIQFLNSDFQTEIEFNKSVNNVINLIDGYDIKKCSINTKQEIFYLYYFNIDCEEVEMTLNKVISGDCVDILNNDESKIIFSLNDNVSERIFWDVLNNIIIVIGKDNLKLLLSEIEKKRWEWIKFNNEEFMNKYIELSASNVYKKVMKRL